MVKIVTRCLLAFGICLVVALITQSVFFLHILLRAPELAPADLIVSFEGRAGRARAAYRLANEGLADALAISPATRAQLRTYDRKYRSTDAYDTLIEKKARTTFENALYTRKIVKENDFNSVILVTSWNHIPRSYLLLKIMLLGSNTRVQVHSVPTGKLNRENWYGHIAGWKMVYNEMVELWGSLVELVKYQIAGEVPDGVPGKSGLASRLKEFFLLEIDSLANTSFGTRPSAGPRAGTVFL